jgi:hypothetical protein
MNMRKLIFCLCLWLGLAVTAPAAPTPKFDEVFKVLSTNLGGVSTEDLNRAAVQGLLGQLGPRAALVDASAAGAWSSGDAAVAGCRVFDGAFAYVRVASVTSNLPAAFRAAYRQLSETNKIKGLVLDLRFAGGTDYEAAAKVADCFLNSDRPLLNWQTGSAQATKKNDAILTPMTILVNSRTTGAAEALAAVLREANVGLILGGTTAGQASLYKEFPLSDGQELRVAVAPVSLSDGKALAHGVVPDIEIRANPEEERAYLQDPYREVHMNASTNGTQVQVVPEDFGSKVITTTNSPAEPRRRFNEAELVRQHRAGEDTEEEMEIGSLPPDVPVIADIVLARALDLLKGLAIVQPARSG